MLPAVHTDASSFHFGEYDVIHFRCVYLSSKELCARSIMLCCSIPVLSMSCFSAPCELV